MKYLKDIAAVIRSKNSGPYELTFDVIFTNSIQFDRFCREKVLNNHIFAELYGIPENQVLSIIEFPPALAVKVTIIRPISSGALGDRDIYGAQQHAPLMGLPLNGWE